MNVEIARPPMFAEIDAKFHIANKAVIFCWGDTIFNPRNIKIPPHLITHEKVHSRRQDGDPEAWWGKYIEDDAFRLHEETLAHIAEYAHLCVGTNRHIRRKALAEVSGRLSGPLYRGLITRDRARRILEEARQTAMDEIIRERAGAM